MSSVPSQNSFVDGVESSRRDTFMAIEAAKQLTSNGTEYKYDEKDVILYNLGIGAEATQLNLVFERSDDFETLPTFGTIPPYSSIPPFNPDLPYTMEDILPKFSLPMLLHGEHYLEIKRYPLPTSGILVSHSKVVEVIDKGTAAIIITAATTKDAITGDEVFYNEFSLFVKDAGGFGGPRKVSDRGAATAVNNPPVDREPDLVVEEKTTRQQAALYRLSGDLNPIHIDPGVSRINGFEVPILHGLCTFGIAGKHIHQNFGRISNMKVRFAGVVIPGQTLQTKMWKEGKRIVYQVVVVETGKLAISNAAAELID
ncbi:hypothetical protein TWF694_007776 [Orbilia ellipsospora]|uniref:MaoC-like domain-containing protein n=1 Tax=Orbilia ellipsospora TaxID=2528407 RepID=A0AAV9XIP9_9PEZI